MTKTTLFIFISTLFILHACKDCTKDKELTDRENALILKEKAFSEKEMDYLNLVKLRDSIQAINDSVQTNSWPENLAGRWNSRIVCVESNCNEYVVGDQRVDVWEFDQDSTGLIARVLNNKNEIVRTYKANYTPQQINLSFQTDSIADRQVNMNILLNNLKPGRISGKRIITIDESCKADFNVELMRSNPK